MLHHAIAGLPDEACGLLGGVPGSDLVEVFVPTANADRSSPTDVDQADNPLLVGWHYVIVSLRDREPMLRSWLLDDRTIVETPVEIVEG